jgi:hypothetical protein
MQQRTTGWELPSKARNRLPLRCPGVQLPSVPLTPQKGHCLFRDKLALSVRTVKGVSLVVFVVIAQPSGSATQGRDSNQDVSERCPPACTPSWGSVAEQHSCQCCTQHARRREEREDRYADAGVKLNYQQMNYA